MTLTTVPNMVTDIHVSFELASKKSHIRLVEWKEGKELYDSVILLEDGERKKLPVRPDAFFSLEDPQRAQGQNHAHFFLEADRWSSSQSRFKQKITAYRAYFEQGLHTKKYGIKSARVLTVGLDEERTRKRCEAAGEVLGKDVQRFYYFAPTAVFSFTTPERVFQDIWISPKDLDTGLRYELIPPLAKREGVV